MSASDETVLTDNSTVFKSPNSVLRGDGNEAATITPSC